MQGWVQREPPAEHASEWYDANHFNGGWSVSTRDDELHVQARALPTHVHSHPVGGGTLRGYCWGEWGGGLEWCPNDGAECQVILGSQDCNTRRILEADEGLFVACGLGHLGGTRGAVHRIAQLGSGRWTAVGTTKFEVENRTVTLKLDDGREVVAHYTNTHQTVHDVTPHPSGGLLVATSEGIYHQSRGTTRKVAGVRGYWGMLYPKSMAVVDGVLYVGMRYAVAAFPLDRETPDYWLVPAGCETLVRAPYLEMVCGGVSGGETEEGETALKEP